MNDWWHNDPDSVVVDELAAEARADPDKAASLVAAMERVWRECIQPNRHVPDVFWVTDDFRHAYQRGIAIGCQFWAKPSGGKLARHRNRQRIAYNNKRRRA